MIISRFKRSVSLAFFFIFLSTVLYFTVAPFSEAQQIEPRRPKLGDYHEQVLDMEVKVQGGYIRVYRMWDGSENVWKINPQHNDLELSVETAGTMYGFTIPRELGRGARVHRIGSGSSGVYNRRDRLENVIPNDMPAQVSLLMSREGIKTCEREGVGSLELMVVNEEGYKWITRPQRKWAQYDRNGRLKSWGHGNYKLGDVERGTNNEVLRYKDALGNVVISFIRNAQGRLESIQDYAGHIVSYTYNANNVLQDVLDADGVKTHYEYTNGYLTLKRYGDVRGANPGEEPGEETTVRLSYSPAGLLTSKTDDDGSQTLYEYEYHERENIFVQIERDNANRIIKRTSDRDQTIRSIEVNGEYEYRQYKLCEDSAILDRSNRLTYIDRDPNGYVKRVIFPNGKSVSTSFERSASGLSLIDLLGAASSHGDLRK